MSLEQKMLIFRRYRSKVFLFWRVLIEKCSDFEDKNNVYILIEGHNGNFKISMAAGRNDDFSRWILHSSFELRMQGCQSANIQGWIDISQCQVVNYKTIVHKPVSCFFEKCHLTNTTERTGFIFFPTKKRLCWSPHSFDWFDGRRSLKIDVPWYFLDLFPIVIFVENAIFSCRQVFWLQQLLPSSEKKTISCLVLHKNSFHGVSNWLKDHPLFWIHFPDDRHIFLVFSISFRDFLLLTMLLGSDECIYSVSPLSR